MTKLLDVVNFNADASCLPSATWIEALSGGSESRLFKWLELYERLERKIVLGLVGATIADIRAFNPEVIELINANPGVFEIVLRPFAHDIALLRTSAGFAKNMELGRKVATETFYNVAPYFLPAEFMLTGGQVWQLRSAGVEGVFINASRFRLVDQEALPEQPFRLVGVLGAELDCIPLNGDLTSAYLEALHAWAPEPWGAALADSLGEICYSWRDGESWFFLPDGDEREAAWLRDEPASIGRIHLRDLRSSGVAQLKESEQKAPYPVHSFAEWNKESRMHGYLSRVHDLELQLEDLDSLELALWLQTIGSDVLSSVEKDPRIVQIARSPRSECDKEWTIRRSARGFEGEEFLFLLERARAGSGVTQAIRDSTEPHMAKLGARSAYLKGV